MYTFKKIYIFYKIPFFFLNKSLYRAHADRKFYFINDNFIVCMWIVSAPGMVSIFNAFQIASFIWKKKRKLAEFCDTFERKYIFDISKERKYFFLYIFTFIYTWNKIFSIIFNFTFIIIETFCIVFRTYFLYIEPLYIL